MAKAPESAPIIGLGSGNRIVSVDLDADSPHILVNASTLHHGSLVYVLDTKRISHPWAHGIDGVTYCRDIADIHDQLIELGQIGGCAPGSPTNSASTPTRKPSAPGC
ncbi:hypothetical protein [Streptomyces griseoaurantiacus]|uniref:hypothetical protein n=1 Tax=Streptomyces griseoaurantiacus TaxID=68213 RepID=UPI0030E419B1